MARERQRRFESASTEGIERYVGQWGPEGFSGGMTTRKNVGMTRASRATAFRELADLVEKGILKTASALGRSASYILVLRESKVTPK